MHSFTKILKPKQTYELWTKFRIKTVQMWEDDRISLNNTHGFNVWHIKSVAFSLRLRLWEELSSTAFWACVYLK